MSADPAAPLIVQASSPQTEPVWAATAIILSAIGGYGVHAGWYSADQLVTLVPAAMVIGLTVWRWYVAQRHATQRVMLADAAPDNIATVAGKKP